MAMYHNLEKNRQIGFDIKCGNHRGVILMKEYINCARTALVCLSELFEIVIEPQTIWSAVGLHGAGGYRA